MLNHDIIAIPIGVPAILNNNTIGRRIDRAPIGRRDINSIVRSSYAAIYRIKPCG